MSPGVWKDRICRLPLRKDLVPIGEARQHETAIGGPVALANDVLIRLQRLHAEGQAADGRHVLARELDDAFELANQPIVFGRAALQAKARGPFMRVLRRAAAAQHCTTAQVTDSDFAADHPEVQEAAPFGHVPARSAQRARAGGEKPQAASSRSSLESPSAWSCHIFSNSPPGGAGRHRAVLDDTAFVEDQNAIEGGQGRKSVGHGDDGAVPHEPDERALDFHLGFGVEGRGGLIEDDDRRVLQEGARDADPLALSP